MSATGIAFRSTSGYVTDAANDTYCLAEAYPTTRGGITFGWDAGMVGLALDRQADLDPRLAGINYHLNNGTQGQFRVDIAPGTYDLRLALGDSGNDQGYQYLQFLDNATVLATIDDSSGTINDHYDDAAGNDLSAANWPSLNVSISKVFSSSLLYLTLATPTSQADFSTITYVQFVQTATGAKPQHYYQMLRNG